MLLPRALNLERKCKSDEAEIIPDMGVRDKKPGTQSRSSKARVSQVYSIGDCVSLKPKNVDFPMITQAIQYPYKKGSSA